MAKPNENLSLAVTVGDVTHVVHVKPTDLVAFERKYDVGLEALERPKAEYIYFLAWNGLRRAGHTSDDFDTWLDLVEDVNEVTTSPLARTRAKR